MTKTRIAIAALVVILGIVGLSATYTVNERDQAIVLQFGKFVKTERSPGLHFKLPFIQNVRYFDRRVLDFDIQPREIPTSDQKQAIVDTFVRYRIMNPLAFLERARTQENFDAALNRIVQAAVSNEFAGVDLATLLTPRRAQLMDRITKKVKDETKEFGVNIIDVRVKRVDLPEQNSKPIIQRMETQRRQEATRIRAEGDRDARRIRAEADKRARVIKADAERRSQILRGQGEALAQQTFNKAVGQDVDFYRFWLAMSEYRKVFETGERKTFVLDPSNPFLRYFFSIDGAVGRTPGAGGGNGAGSGGGSGTGQSGTTSAPAPRTTTPAGTTAN